MLLHYYSFSVFSFFHFQAKKPAFFSGNAPFRLYDEKSGKLSYEKVTKMEKGRVYSGVRYPLFTIG